MVAPRPATRPAAHSPQTRFCVALCPDFLCAVPLPETTARRNKPKPFHHNNLHRAFLPRQEIVPLLTPYPTNTYDMSRFVRFFPALISRIAIPSSNLAKPMKLDGSVFVRYYIPRARDGQQACGGDWGQPVAGAAGSDSAGATGKPAWSASLRPHQPSLGEPVECGEREESR